MKIIRLKFKTLRELLATKGIEYKYGAFRCEGQENSVTESMFDFCGQVFQSRLIVTTPSFVKINGFRIYPWMCSHWEIVPEGESAFESYGIRDFYDDCGNNLSVELNTSDYMMFVEEEDVVCIQVNGECIGLTTKQAQEVVHAVEEIIDIKKLTEE